MKWDHFLADGLAFAKYVAVGHWPVTLYRSDFPCCNPIIDRERRILSLDGGCGVKEDGQLNLLILPDWRSDDFELCTWSPLKEIIALDAQEETAGSTYIHWGDHVVQVLEQNGDTARISHHGKELLVPSGYLWPCKEGTGCSDVTDRKLAVLPGERLLLVDETKLGCYVQKNGCSGWYTGRFERG